MRFFEALLSLTVAMVCCLIVMALVLYASQQWYLRDCIAAGPGTALCHAAALYQQWWWLAVPVVACGVATWLFMRRS